MPPRKKKDITINISNKNISNNRVKLDFNILQNKIKQNTENKDLKKFFSNSNYNLNDKFNSYNRLNKNLSFDLEFHNFFKKKKKTIVNTWLEKYRILDLESNSNYLKYKTEIDKWINFFYNKESNTIIKKKVTDKPFLLLHGPPGTGKTTLAHSIYKSLGFDILEINSSECRSGTELKTYLETSYQSVLTDKKTNKQMGIGIIMDEIDGISNNECTGLHLLLNYMFFGNIPSINNETSVRYPVIATCNSIKENKLKKLLKYSIVLQIKDVNFNSLNNLVKKITY